jgi:hypothetical protein
MLLGLLASLTVLTGACAEFVPEPAPSPRTAPSSRRSQPAPAPSPAPAPARTAAIDEPILHLGIDLRERPALLRQDWGRAVADVVWLSQSELGVEPAKVTEARRKDPSARKIGYTVEEIGDPVVARRAAEGAIRRSGHRIPKGRVYVLFDNESWAPFMYGRWCQTRAFDELSGAEADRYNEAALRGMIEYTKVWQQRFPDAKFGWHAIPEQAAFVRTSQTKERFPGVTEKLTPLLRQADVIWMRSYDRVVKGPMDTEEEHYRYHVNNLKRQKQLADELGKTAIAYGWGLRSDETWRNRAFFRACHDLGIQHACFTYNVDNPAKIQGLIPEARARSVSESEYWKEAIEQPAIEAGFLSR